MKKHGIQKEFMNLNQNLSSHFYGMKTHTKFVFLQLFFQKPKIAHNSLNKSRRAVLTPFLDIKFF